VQRKAVIANFIVFGLMRLWVERTYNLQHSWRECIATLPLERGYW